ncbi:MAG: dihydrofolate reductase family protein [Bryobacteraceae bacterium]
MTIVSAEERDVLSRLKASPGKDIWLFGGGSLFRSLYGQGLVDTVEVATVPVLLGGGIPLAPGLPRHIELSLTGHKVYAKSGIVSLQYAINQRDAGK